jgi:hypothetical protein
MKKPCDSVMYNRKCPTGLNKIGQVKFVLRSRVCRFKFTSCAYAFLKFRTSICNYFHQLSNSVAVSPEASYTYWEAAAGRRILVPTLANSGMSLGQRSGNPTVINLGFLDRSRDFFFQVAPHLSSWGWVDSARDPLLLRKYGSAGNRTPDL